MIAPVVPSLNYQLASKLLDASVLRHEAIATNLANVETPGFRRIDLAADFSRALQSQFAAGARPTPSDLHAITPTLAEDPNVRTIRPDGNSVEIETELMAMSRNQVDHGFLTELVSRHIKQLKVAITGRIT